MPGGAASDARAPRSAIAVLARSPCIPAAARSSISARASQWIQPEVRRVRLRCQTDGRQLRRGGLGVADGHGAAFRLPRLDRFAAFAKRPIARGEAEDLPYARAEREQC